VFSLDVDSMVIYYRRDSVDCYKCLDVEKSYRKIGNRKSAVGLNTTNLEFKNGEIIGVVGTSRSGKSALIDILSGKVRPNAGRLTYDAREISRVYRESLIKLNKNMTVYDNMVYFGKKEKMNELEVENRMAQLRDVFTLNKYINTKAGELDVCNRVKSELAMLLLKNPRILFIDDAFSFLDNTSKNDILKCLKRLNKLERTVIVIAATSVGDVEKIINRIVLISNSSLIYDNSLEDFKKKYCDKKVFEVYLNKNVSINRIDGVEVLESSDYYYKLLFDNVNGMFANVINLFDVNTIVDLKVNDERLSDIIKKIKG
jgi:ABC-type multidrug transport system ATPase subunit